MEELATCVCGNQTWEIFSDRVVCAKCDHRYNTNTVLMGAAIIQHVNNQSDLERRARAAVKAKGGE
jgi:hypothetical protein